MAPRVCFGPYDLHSDSRQARSEPVYELYIANKNYSSWSLRPWVLMRELQLPFTERLLPFGHRSIWEDYRKISASGKVPCLVDGEIAVWDSLAIAEYLAERHDTVWPASTQARAQARAWVDAGHTVSCRSARDSALA